MTDNLVKRLRELAPTVYSENDAVASKANELVMVAKTVQNQYDQVTMLRDSLQVTLWCFNTLMESILYCFMGLTIYSGRDIDIHS